jgi:hypothetical protein
MLACDQTVQCFDCLCVWYGDDDQTFLTAHPAPWELLEDEDAATSRLDYGALAMARDLKLDDEDEDPRHDCHGRACAICTELRDMYEDPIGPGEHEVTCPDCRAQFHAARIMMLRSNALLTQALRETLDKWQGLAEDMCSPKFQPPSDQKLRQDLERIMRLRQLLTEEPTP